MSNKNKYPAKRQQVRVAGYVNRINPKHLTYLWDISVFTYVHGDNKASSYSRYQFMAMKGTDGKYRVKVKGLYPEQAIEVTSVVGRESESTNVFKALKDAYCQKPVV